MHDTHACRRVPNKLENDPEDSQKLPSSLQQSLSLSMNPASGSHSQASPDPAPSLSLAGYNGGSCGAFNGGYTGLPLGDDDDSVKHDINAHAMHGDPENLPEASEVTEGSGLGSGFENVEFDSQNVPSPSSQSDAPDRRLMHEGVVFSGCR